MSNADVFGSPMILTPGKAVSPFGAASKEALRGNGRARRGRRLIGFLRRVFLRSDEQRRVRKTIVELSKLDNHMLRDIGLNRAAIISAAHEAERMNRRGKRRQRR